MTSSTRTTASAHYAAFDATSGSADTAAGSTGRHRATQTEAVELELAQIRERLDKLRQRMRAALTPRIMAGLGLAAVLLVTLALVSLISFAGGDGGMGMLLGGAFVAGVPLTAAAAIRAGQPWWQLSHEAALLRQRETELHESREGVMVDGVASYGASDSVGGSPLYGSTTDVQSSASTTDRAPRADYDPSYTDALHLAEYSALSPSSHVLARAMHDTIGAGKTETPDSDAAPSDRNRRLLDTATPRQPGVKHTDPSWWSPTGLNARATQHATPADRTPVPVGGLGVVVAVGALMTLFALGIIAGVLTSA